VETCLCLVIPKHVTIWQDIKAKQSTNNRRVEINNRNLYLYDVWHLMSALYVTAALTEVKALSKYKQSLRSNTMKVVSG
jgi:hypothetical protein